MMVRSLQSHSRMLARNLALLAFLALLGFVLPRLIPGSPLTLTGEETDALRLGLSSAAAERFADYYAPDLPWHEQLARYFTQLLRGDLGYSFHYGMPVWELIQSRIGWTLGLSLTAIAMAVTIAIPLGVRLAISAGRKWTHVVLQVLLILQTLPDFLLAIVGQLIFSYQMGWLPSHGAYTPGLTKADVGYLASVAEHFILPLAVLVVSRAPGLAILTRNVVQAVRREPYVEVARFNGVSEHRIRRSYILRNSLPEILGRLNIHLLYAVAGALFVEMVFSYPGLGNLLKTAVSARDYPLVQGVFLVTCLYSIAVNTLFELVLAAVNPRLRS